MLRTWSVGIHYINATNIIPGKNLSEDTCRRTIENLQPKKHTISQIIIQKSIVLIDAFPYTVVKHLV
ncbi:hypothetical protein C1I60_03750 [Paenibacillus terrae]|uniref:Uncharacterized protein n=1 Tax=Paenibacillus terrae TaxID=159743 RepID=A0A4U2Q744_9BACL|nr:hypothetical protein C1I60_03750 [Paenibacillus terrae]